jgi:hypothetical protein
MLQLKSKPLAPEGDVVKPHSDRPLLWVFGRSSAAWQLTWSREDKNLVFDVHRGRGS